MEGSKHLNDIDSVGESSTDKLRSIRTRKQKSKKIQEVLKLNEDKKIISKDWKCSGSLEDGNDEGIGSIL